MRPIYLFEEEEKKKKEPPVWVHEMELEEEKEEGFLFANAMTRTVGVSFFVLYQSPDDIHTRCLHVPKYPDDTHTKRVCTSTSGRCAATPRARRAPPCDCRPPGAPTGPAPSSPATASSGPTLRAVAHNRHPTTYPHVTLSVPLAR